MVPMYVGLRFMSGAYIFVIEALDAKHRGAVTHRMIGPGRPDQRSHTSWGWDDMAGTAHCRTLNGKKMRWPRGAQA